MAGVTYKAIVERRRGRLFAKVVDRPRAGAAIILIVQTERRRSFESSMAPYCGGPKLLGETA